MRPTYFWFTIAFVLMVAIAPAPNMMPRTQVAQAQAAAPEIVNVTEIPSYDDVKYPDVLGAGSRAFISGGSNKSDRKALHVYTDPPYKTISNPIQMGDAKGTSDYSTSTMARAEDGTIYQIWASSTSYYIKIRRLDPNAAGWTDERTVISGKIFRAFPDIAVTAKGRIYVTWWQDGYFYYNFSDSRGDNWSSGQRVSSIPAAGRPILSADKLGGMWIVFGGGGGSSTAGRIWAGLFPLNGTGFDVRDIAPDRAKDLYYADPTITVFPSNIPAIAWRALDNGIYYAERDPATGNWNRSRLVGGKATSYGTVAIVSDATGNIHLGWSGNSSGRYELWYAFKPFGLDWRGPIQLTDNGDLKTNVAISETIADAAYGHMVSERFTGRGLKTYYAALKNVIGCAIKEVSIDNKAEYSTDADLQVSIVPEDSCQPTQMQVSINVPPTATTPGRIPYSASTAITIPAEYAQQCIQTVYVALYKDANSAYNPSLVKSDTIVYDAIGDVDAYVSARNPNLGSRNPTYTPFQGFMDAPGAQRASNGDPAWTGTLQYYMSINDAGDCSKLKQFVVGGTTVTMPTGSFSGVLGLPYPTSTAPGAKPFDVIVYDGLNNSKIYPQLINYDPIDDPSNTQADESGRPVVNRVNIAGDNASASARKSILRTLTFSDTNVTDNLYRPNNPGTQFWGMWVANGPRNVANPDPASLAWFPVQVDQPATDFSVKWNLFNAGPGPRLDQEGSYTVFVRFLDGAGNPSTRIVSTTLQLDAGYSLPSIVLPVVIKP